jgi:NO-binding membrane sensor protein with MHYT domain
MASMSLCGQVFWTQQQFALNLCIALARKGAAVVADVEQRHSHALPFTSVMGNANKIELFH